MKRWLLGLAMAALVAPAADAADERKFDATALEYNINNSPQITGKKFTSKVTVFEQGMVRVVEIKNFISGKSAPDVLVKIASSSDSVGSVIYNDKMEVIAEYPRGVYVNSNLSTFKGGDDKRRLSGSWYTGADQMLSDFMITDETGTVLYKETVIYTLKR